MIGFLEGQVFDVSGEVFILNVNGVGYEILGSAQTLNDVQVLLGQNMKVWIYSHVREDAFQLFGFLTRPEKEFFCAIVKSEWCRAKIGVVGYVGRATFAYTGLD